MPRGQPDYGLYTQTPVASGISDPGEAAARLGSINVYDRRGWTVWMDNFEAPVLKWTSSRAGAGVAPLLVTTDAWMGVQSVYFDTPAGALNLSTMSKHFPLLRLGQAGFEFWIRGYTRTAGYFRARFDINDATNHTRAELQIDLQADTVSIVTPAGVIVIAIGLFPDLVFLPFIPIKVVIDMDNDNYIRLLVGSNEYDISAHALVTVGISTARYITTGFQLHPDIAEDTYVWLDNFILTQNEP